VLKSIFANVSRCPDNSHSAARNYYRREDTQLVGPTYNGRGIRRVGVHPHNGIYLVEAYEKRDRLAILDRNRSYQT